MNGFYKYTETGEIKTGFAWRRWFSKNGNKGTDGWSDSISWFADMVRNGLLVEV